MVADSRIGRCAIANYLDFLRVFEREGRARRLTYACGTQNVLVEEVVDAVKMTLDVSDMNLVTLSADQDKPARIYAELNQYPLNPTDHRLIIVRECQSLKSWEPLAEWLTARTIPNVHAAMVAREREWPATRDPKVREKVVKSNSALYVECNLPRSAPEKQAVEIITSWSNLSREVAAHLAKRTGYDLARCRDVCRWTNNLRGEVTTKHVDALVQQSSTETYANALTHMRRAEAATAAQELEPREVRKAIGTLASRLTDLDRINRSMQHALAKHPDKGKLAIAQAETAKLSGVPLITVQQMWSTAKHYDPPAVTHRTELLVRADRSADKTGVLELLAAEW